MSLCPYVSQYWNKVSTEHGQELNQSQKTFPNENCRNTTLQRKMIFVSVADFLQWPFFPLTSQPWVCWPEVLFQWVDWPWNQTGITLLPHSGFTQFTYNSLLIVLDHQLILCSQEASAALHPLSVAESYCPQEVDGHITSWYRTRCAQFNFCVVTDPHICYKTVLCDLLEMTTADSWILKHSNYF